MKVLWSVPEDTPDGLMCAADALAWKMGGAAVTTCSAPVGILTAVTFEDDDLGREFLALLRRLGIAAWTPSTAAVAAVPGAWPKKRPGGFP